MILNDIQRMDFYQGLKQISDLMVESPSQHLDLKGVENKIQQTIGILNLLDRLDFNDKSFRTMMIHTLKSLYQRKKELNYGYVEENKYSKELAAC